ncbi:type IV secretion system protein VirB6 [Paenibacillus thiaminolyticus]|uniref:type IV secretion system protein VirB6 n=1 Tax=Paenibacillus thiaminolyticus TaxID=49283 RepID=UPI00232DB114|nr:type IV secretion system protein VirB6 [Paenibacillus thiaminolyticus]WCF06159.1 type IV secretion system protein VirB6 [Paenibacillus thiaminolyticus]
MISQAIRAAAAALLIGIFAWTAAAAGAFPAEFEPGNTAPSAKVPPVQLFDMQQERIIKTIPNQEEHQAAAREWLQSVTGLAPQMTLDSRCGYIVRIPLEAPVEIKLPPGPLKTKDVFLIYCPDKDPLLLVFSEQRKPFLLRISSNVKPFMQKLLAPASPKQVTPSSS